MSIDWSCLVCGPSSHRSAFRCIAFRGAMLGAFGGPLEARLGLRATTRGNGRALARVQEEVTHPMGYFSALVKGARVTSSGLLLGYVSDGFRGLLHGPSP